MRWVCDTCRFGLGWAVDGALGCMRYRCARRPTVTDKVAARHREPREDCGRHDERKDEEWDG